MMFVEWNWLLSKCSVTIRSSSFIPVLELPKLPEPVTYPVPGPRKELYRQETFAVHE
jgi:hypothetical protein